jgi:hypothetical protein
VSQLGIWIIGRDFDHLENVEGLAVHFPDDADPVSHELSESGEGSGPDFVDSTFADERELTASSADRGDMTRLTGFATHHRPAQRSHGTCGRRDANCETYKHRSCNHKTAHVQVGRALVVAHRRHELQRRCQPVG